MNKFYVHIVILKKYWQNKRSFKNFLESVKYFKENINLLINNSSSSDKNNNTENLQKWKISKYVVGSGEKILIKNGCNIPKWNPGRIWRKSHCYNLSKKIIQYLLRFLNDFWGTKKVCTIKILSQKQGK